MSEIDNAAWRALLDARWVYLGSTYAPMKCLEIAIDHVYGHSNPQRGSVYDTAMRALSLHLDVPTHRVWDAIHWPESRHGLAFALAANVLEPYEPSECVDVILAGRMCRIMRGRQ